MVASVTLKQLMVKFKFTKPQYVDFITGFDAEACLPLHGTLFSPLKPLYSLMGVGVTRPSLSTNWSGRVLQAISSVCYPKERLHATANALELRFITLNHWGLVMAIWWLTSGSTLAHVMACCLMASSHYLDQTWLIINRESVALS